MKVVGRRFQWKRESGHGERGDRLGSSSPHRSGAEHAALLYARDPAYPVWRRLRDPQLGPDRHEWPIDLETFDSSDDADSASKRLERSKRRRGYRDNGAA